MLIDTHCHIQFNAYKDDADAVVKNCAERGVIMNAVGTQIDTSRKAVEFAAKYASIYATIGLHPIHLFQTHVDEEESSFNTRGEDFDYEAYKELGRHPKVIAVGECGLELFHAPSGVDKSAVLEKQKNNFLLQVKLAEELEVPLVIHVRDAHAEMIRLLKSLRRKFNGVVHCFTADWPAAESYLELGLNLGFTGVITFPPKKKDPEAQANLLQVVAKCPADKILAETDSPYLAPQNYRGQRAEPWMVEEVIKKIAEIRQKSAEEIAAVTEKNARRLFARIK